MKILKSFYDYWLIKDYWDNVILKSRTTWLLKEKWKWFIFSILDHIWNTYLIKTNDNNYANIIWKLYTKWNINFNENISKEAKNITWNIQILFSNDIDKKDKKELYKVNSNIFNYPIDEFNVTAVNNYLESKKKFFDNNDYINVNETLISFFLQLNIFNNSILEFNKKEAIYALNNLYLTIFSLKDIFDRNNYKLISTYYFDTKWIWKINVYNNFISLYWEFFKIIWNFLKTKLWAFNNLWRSLDKFFWKEDENSNKSTKKYYNEQEILNKLWTFKNQLLEIIKNKELNKNTKKKKELVIKIFNYLFLISLEDDFLNPIWLLDYHNIKNKEDILKLIEYTNTLFNKMFDLIKISIILHQKFWNEKIINDISGEIKKINEKEWFKQKIEEKNSKQINIKELWIFKKSRLSNKLYEISNILFKDNLINSFGQVDEIFWMLNITKDFFDKTYKVAKKYYEEEKYNDTMQIEWMFNNLEFTCRLDIRAVWIEGASWFNFSLNENKERKDLRKRYEKIKSNFKEEDDLLTRYFSITWLIDKYYRYIDKYIIDNKDKIIKWLIVQEHKALIEKYNSKNELLDSITLVEQRRQIENEKKEIIYKVFLDNLLNINNYLDDYIKVQKFLKEWTSVTKEMLVKIVENKMTNESKNFIKLFEWLFLYKNTTWVQDFYLSDIIKQLEYEYFVISFLWYASYFLVVKDYVTFWKTANIAVWPWRWSAWWVLASYLLKIIDVDPVLFELSFERMIHVYKPQKIFYSETEEEIKEKWIIYDNEELEDSDILPDIDVDFWDRTELYEYIKKKYWYYNVAKIWTVMSLKLKSAFKELTRTSWVDFWILNEISKEFDIFEQYYIQEWDEIWKKIYELLKEYIDSWEWLDKVSQTVKEFIKIYWNKLKPAFAFLSNVIDKPRWLWAHACWVVIANSSLTKSTWLRKESNSSILITEMDKKEIMKLWYIKYDFLWLESIQIIKEVILTIFLTQENIRKKYFDIKTNTKEEILAKWEKHWYELYYDILAVINSWTDEEKEVYENIFKNALTNNIFQFESDWIKNALVKIQPDNIEDLTAVSALYRPWPMQFIPLFANLKHWIEQFELFSKDDLEEIYKVWKEKWYTENEINKTLDMIEKLHLEITRSTHKSFVYQEQIVKFFAESWINFRDVDILRKKINLLTEPWGAWDKIRKIFNQALKAFKEKKWYNEVVINKYVEKYIISFAWYAFNKSHALAYSVISYLMWYFKYYYPDEFYAVVLEHNYNTPAKFSSLLDEMNNIKLLNKKTSDNINILDLYLPPLLEYSDNKPILLDKKENTEIKGKIQKSIRNQLNSYYI